MILGYVYNADLYCPDCIVQAVAEAVLQDADPETGSWTKRPYGTEAQLFALAAQLGVNPEREETYDSDTFPKVLVSGGEEPGDRCASCGEEL